MQAQAVAGASLAEPDDPFNWTPCSFDKVLASLHDEVSELLAA